MDITNNNTNNTNNTNNINNNVDEKKLFQSINKLPIELVDIIQTYIPQHIWRPLNKILYVENYDLVYIKMKPNNVENYIRYVVKRDFGFVFNYVVLRNLFKWYQMRDYLNDFLIYPNYIYFIKDYCISNHSINCLNTLNEILKRLGYEKKLSKKKTIRSILNKNG